MRKKRNFDFISPYYDWLVRLVFGTSMFRAQSLFLNRISRGASILVLGGGTGLWLNDLLRLNPDCRIVYIDSSKRMIDQARKNLSNDRQVDFRLGNERSINKDDYFDTVIAYCYLDLFTNSQLSDVISVIGTSTAKKCQWIVVDFVSTSWWHRVMLFSMYIFFNLTTGLRTKELPQWERILQQGNLIPIEEELFYNGFIKSTVFLGQ